jgi:uncharacterized protein
MDVIVAATAFAKSRLMEYDGAHDWFHTERVLTLSRHIQKSENKGNIQIIELSAILHDIADTKFHKGPESDGGDMAYEFLREHGLSEDDAGHIRRIINNLSFKKILVRENINSMEFQIVMDADRLDAMGAVGIARAFNYGGFKNRALFDPEVSPVKYKTMDDYKNSEAPTINHFYEKLFLLKDLMNTQTAKNLAEERHEYMLEFVKRFIDEWQGKV